MENMVSWKENKIQNKMINMIVKNSVLIFVFEIRNMIIILDHPELSAGVPPAASVVVVVAAAVVVVAATVVVVVVAATVVVVVVLENIVVVVVLNIVVFAGLVVVFKKGVVVAKSVKSWSSLCNPIPKPKATANPTTNRPAVASAPITNGLDCHALHPVAPPRDAYCPTGDPYCPTGDPYCIILYINKY